MKVLVVDDGPDVGGLTAEAPGRFLKDGVDMMLLYSWMPWMSEGGSES